MRFAVSYHSAIGAFVFVVYRYLYLSDQQSNTVAHEVQIFLGIFLMISFLVGIASVAMLAQNRSYFVIAARQANTIRDALFKRGSLASRIQSVFPTNPDEPKMFNPKSTHLVTLFLLGVVNSISFAFGILFFVIAAKSGLWLYFYLPITCGLIVLIGQFLLIKHVFL